MDQKQQLLQASSSTSNNNNNNSKNVWLNSNSSGCLESWLADSSPSYCQDLMEEASLWLTKRSDLEAIVASDEDLSRWIREFHDEKEANSNKDWLFTAVLDHAKQSKRPEEPIYDIMSSSNESWCIGSLSIKPKVDPLESSWLLDSSSFKDEKSSTVSSLDQDQDDEDDPRVVEWLSLAALDIPRCPEESNIDEDDSGSSIVILDENNEKEMATEQYLRITGLGEFYNQNQVEHEEESSGFWLL